MLLRLVVLLAAVLAVRGLDVCPGVSDTPVPIDPETFFPHHYDAFTSFTNCTPAWMVDGHDHYAAVADAIEAAKEEVIIVGWKIHPEVMLRGRGTASPKTLLSFLEDAVKRKVKVYVMNWMNSIVDLGKDWDGMRVAECVQELTAIGASVVVSRGHGWTPIFRWSHHQKTVSVDRAVSFVGGIDLAMGRYDTSDHLYTNPARNEPDSMHWDRIIQNKPWHDMAVRVDGPAAASVALNAVQRWRRFCAQYHLTTPAGCHEAEMPPTDLPSPGHTPPAALDQCQVVRTTGFWSYGRDAPDLSHEQSILSAVLAAVAGAQHYIHIEQQYFASQPFSNNGLSYALFAKISSCMAARRTLRVVVVLPLSPEEDHMIYPTQKTIELDPTALWPRLVAFVYANRNISAPGTPDRAYWDSVHVEDYLTMLYPFAWDYDEAAATAHLRQVFVHAKALIVDDRVVVLGSANANDRSFLIDRDSEINVVARPVQAVTGMMAGEKFLKGKAAKGLRMQLWREHLRVADECQYEDPASAAAYTNLLRATAVSNSAIIAAVWGMRPEKLNVETDFTAAENDGWVRTGITGEQAALLKQLRGQVAVYAHNTWGDDERQLASILEKLPWAKEIFQWALPPNVGRQ